MITSVRKVTSFLLVSLMLFLLGVFSDPQPAEAKFDFGGDVLWWQWCYDGVYVLNSIPKPVPNLSYVWGFSAMKQYGPPHSIRQRELGYGAGFHICMVPCHFGLCPIPQPPGLLVWPEAGTSLK